MDNIGNAEMEKLEAFEMWLWRKLDKINRSDYKTNEKVLQLVQEKSSMVNTLERRQMSLIGKSLLKTVLEGRSLREEPTRKTKKCDVGLDDG